MTKYKRVVSQQVPSQDAIWICDGTYANTVFRITSVKLIPENDRLRLSYGFVIESSPLFESGVCDNTSFQKVVGDILVDILDQKDYTIGKHE